MKPAAKPRLRLCVLEDEPALLHLLETALTYLGHEVDLCRSGTDLLATIDRGAYDLLLLDFERDPRGGVEVLDQLQERGVETPTILMGSRVPREFRSPRRRSANVSLLLKPFTLAGLQWAITTPQAFPGRVFR